MLLSILTVFAKRNSGFKVISRACTLWQLHTQHALRASMKGWNKTEIKLIEYLTGNIYVAMKLTFTNVTSLFMGSKNVNIHAMNRIIRKHFPSYLLPLSAFVFHSCSQNREDALPW